MHLLVLCPLNRVCTEIRWTRKKEGANMKTTDCKGDTDGSAEDRYIS